MRNLAGTILAETVGKSALVGIANGSAVRIALNITGVLVGLIDTVIFAIAKEDSIHAFSITAGQLVLLTEGLEGVEERFGEPLLFFLVAVFDVAFPVTGLEIQVERQSVRTSQCLETSLCTLDDIATVFQVEPKPFSSSLIPTQFPSEGFSFIFCRVASGCLTFDNFTGCDAKQGKR